MTSRQVAVLLAEAGHDVDLLAPAGRPPLRYPSSLQRAYVVPAFGADPWGWLNAAEKIVREGGHDVVIPTGDQVAVFSRTDVALTWLAGRVAVPRFPALERVQDKISAAVTLTEIGLPQPESFVVRSAEALRQISDPPLYVKLPIGSASTGVHHVTRREELLRLADRLDTEGAFATDGGLLVQQPVQGPVISAQSVFDNGRLVAAHSYLHTRPGSRGGAAGKRGVDLPSVSEHITLLGAHIGWHGALSMDGILTDDGPVWIDVNPRLVEPANAARSGVDLLGALIAVSLGQSPSSLPVGEPDVVTHQFVQALWAAGEQSRRAVWRELWHAATRTGPYRDSTEELLAPLREPKAIAGLFGLCAALVTAPAGTLRRAVRNADRNAMTAHTWQRIIAGAPPAP
ncbi:MAG TPA: hypothetical protein VLH10_23495 [Yinghuangia sp.]|uniref:hypothetical protein n=1 Tax=Yinghuangia sp. YIM S10712 TaxID=3436930 RepID=UPI002C3FB214|nr:hypothetical protein [Yinghuangia sp.]